MEAARFARGARERGSAMRVLGYIGVSLVRISVLLLLAAVAAFPVDSARAACAGDCHDDGAVTLDELVLGVNIILGQASLADCAALDSSGDGTITVDELITAINKALNGCTAEGAETIHLLQYSPSFAEAFTTASNPVTITGSGSGPIASIQWENLTTGQTGTGTGTESWAVDVPLQAGDNRIEITALATEEAESVTMPLTATYNRLPTFTSLVQLTPDTGFEGYPENNIYVRVGIDETNLDPSSVAVHGLDESGNKADLLGALTDDGNMANGDEVAGDGVYSARISLSSDTLDSIRMRVFADTITEGEVMTSVFSFLFLPVPTDEQLVRQTSTNELSLSKFDELIHRGMDAGLPEAQAAVNSLAELAAFIEGLDGVVASGYGDFSAWWLNELGITFVIDATDLFADEVLGGRDRTNSVHLIRPTDPAPVLEELETRDTQVAYLRTGEVIPDPVRIRAASARREADRVGNLDAIFISPYASLNSKYDQVSAWNVLTAPSCLTKKTDERYTGQDPFKWDIPATPNDVPELIKPWKELNKYGVIATLTHGDNIKGLARKLTRAAIKAAVLQYAAKEAEYIQEFPNESEETLTLLIAAQFREKLALINSWNDDARECFHTNVGVDFSTDAWKLYMGEVDDGGRFANLRRAIARGRVVAPVKFKEETQGGAKKRIPSYYALMITPEFVAHHNRAGFPKSIWFASSCQSYSTHSMAGVFRQMGGLAYVGFSNVVAQQYGVGTQRFFFNALLNDDMNVGEALSAIRAVKGDPTLGENDGEDDKPGGAAYIKGDGSAQAWVCSVPPAVLARLTWEGSEDLDVCVSVRIGLFFNEYCSSQPGGYDSACLGKSNRYDTVSLSDEEAPLEKLITVNVKYDYDSSCGAPPRTVPFTLYLQYDGHNFAFPDEVEWGKSVRVVEFSREEE